MNDIDTGNKDRMATTLRLVREKAILETEIARLKDDYEIQMRATDAAEAEVERLREIVSAIDEREDDKPTRWRYRREALADMARRALEQARKK